MASLVPQLLAQQTPNFPVYSEFDGDPDGWESTSSDLFHFPTGGSPDGWIGYEDQDSGGGEAIAPPKYLGNWSSLDEAGFITFRFRILRTGDSPGLEANPYRVTIFGENGDFAEWEADNPGTATDWIRFRVPLRESRWTLSPGADWGTILSNVTEFRIKMEMFSNLGGIVNERERTGLDNVALMRFNPEGECPELTIKYLPFFAFPTENNQNYRLECSQDGVNFFTLADFEGDGGMQFYTDRRLLGKRKFYRLRCADGSGSLPGNVPTPLTRRP